MITDRLRKLQKTIKQSLLIKKKENLFYLTGYVFDYRAEEYLLVKPRKINTNRKRMNTDVVAFGSGLEKIEWAEKVDQLKNISRYIKRGSRLDIEYKFTYGEGAYLKYKLPGVQIKPSRSAVDVMRQIKDADEISKIRKSMRIVAQVYKLVRKEIQKPQITEERLAKFIQTAGLRLGAEDISFPAIVASGANAAVPHHVPGNKKLRPHESIILDFGFKHKQYCSDFTRTVFLKSAPKKLAEAYEQVEKAYIESILFCNLSVPRRHSGHLPSRGEKAQRVPINIRPSPFEERGRGEIVTGNDVYKKAVDILAEKKLDKYFIHSLGHGTGLEIHELPNLSPKSKDVMQNGMVFSIEPGVYFPKAGGIRIEDLAYLNDGKVKKFIDVPTSLRDNIL